MNVYKRTVYILAVLLLTACSQQPYVTPEVDRANLLRSMTYTHRHFVELELGIQPIKETARWELLRQSHCDLIDRDFVHSENAGAQCLPPANKSAQHCIASFHRCIGKCPTFKQSCESCEQKATQCLVE